MNAGLAGGLTAAKLASPPHRVRRMPETCFNLSTVFRTVADTVPDPAGPGVG